MTPSPCSLDVEPDALPATLALGHCLIDASRVEEAERLLNADLPCHPWAADLLCLPGELLYRGRKYPQKIEYVRRALPIELDTANDWNMLGVALQ